jgi:DnaK suppressor protein
MRDGSYGRCSDCDKPIPLARLQLVPWAERCTADQAASEGPTHHSTL